MDDALGVIYKGREQNDKYSEELAQVTNLNDLHGDLKDAVKNADVFIGLSKGGILTEEMFNPWNTSGCVCAGKPRAGNTAR